MKRKHEARSEDGPQGETTETELGSRTKRPRIMLTSNSLPNSVATTTAPATSYSAITQFNGATIPICTTCSASESEYFLPSLQMLHKDLPRQEILVARCSSRHTTPVSSLNPSKNHTSLSAPNSRPPPQPSSRVSSPTGWPPILHFPIPLPPSQPPSRPTSPRHIFRAFEY